MDRNPHEIYRTRRENDIKMNLKEGWEDTDRIYLGQEKRILAFFEHGKGTYGFIKCGHFLLAEELFVSPRWSFTLL